MTLVLLFFAYILVLSGFWLMLLETEGRALLFPALDLWLQYFTTKVISVATLSAGVVFGGYAIPVELNEIRNACPVTTKMQLHGHYRLRPLSRKRS